MAFGEGRAGELEGMCGRDGGGGGGGEGGRLSLILYLSLFHLFISSPTFSSPTEDRYILPVCELYMEPLGGVTCVSWTEWRRRVDEPDDCYCLFGSPASLAHFSPAEDPVFVGAPALRVREQPVRSVADLTCVTFCLLLQLMNSNEELLRIARLAQANLETCRRTKLI